MIKITVILIKLISKQFFVQFWVSILLTELSTFRMLVEHFLPNQSFRCRVPLLAKTCSGVAEINGEVYVIIWAHCCKARLYLMTNDNEPHLSLKGEFHGSAHVRAMTSALSSSLLLDQLETSTQHRRDIVACWLDIYNLIGQCFGHVSERNKKRKAEKLPHTYLLRTRISSAFSDRLTIV